MQWTAQMIHLGQQGNVSDQFSAWADTLSWGIANFEKLNRCFPSNHPHSVLFLQEEKKLPHRIKQFRLLGSESYLNNDSLRQTTKCHSSEMIPLIWHIQPHSTNWIRNVETATGDAIHNNKLTLIIAAAVRCWKHRPWMTWLGGQPLFSLTSLFQSIHRRLLHEDKHEVLTPSSTLENEWK